MSRTTWRILSLALDALSINAGLVAAFVVRFGWPPPEFNFAAYERTFLAVTVAQLVIFSLAGLYEPMMDLSGPSLMAAVAKGLLLGLVVLGFFSFLLRAFSYPRTVIVIGFLTQLLLVYGWRRVAGRLLTVRWPERRVMVVGSVGDTLTVAERLLRLRRWGHRLVAVVTERSLDPEEAASVGLVKARGGDRDPAPMGAAPMGEDVEVHSGLEDLTGLIHRLQPDQLILATPERHRHVLEEVTLSGFRGEILVVPQLYEVHLGEVSFALIEDLPLLRLTRSAGTAWRDSVKGWGERFVALVLLMVLAPALLLVSGLVLLLSGRPVLYRQERLGKAMEPFTLFKFRTMVRDAEGSGPVLASADDPRVTGVGRYLRRSRLDELPQLYNVLLGDMGFVGPRPERREFVAEHIERDPLYRERFQIRPGITGLAQVSGSYATTAAIKLRFDLMYIHHQSLGLDLRILVRTLGVVLTGRGAV